MNIYIILETITISKYFDISKYWLQNIPLLIAIVRNDIFFL